MYTLKYAPAGDTISAWQELEKNIADIEDAHAINYAIGTNVNGGLEFPICGGLKIPTSQFLVYAPKIVFNVRNGGMANDKRSTCKRNEHHSDIQRNRI